MIGTIENSMIKTVSLKEDHTNRYYEEMTLVKHSTLVWMPWLMWVPRSSSIKRV